MNYFPIQFHARTIYEILVVFLCKQIFSRPKVIDHKYNKHSKESCTFAVLGQFWNFLLFFSWTFSKNILCFQIFFGKKFKFLYIVKVRQSQNDLYKSTFPPKNELSNSTLLLWNFRSTCFHWFFGGNWRHQKDISKLTDL